MGIHFHEFEMHSNPYKLLVGSYTALLVRISFNFFI